MQIPKQIKIGAFHYTIKIVKGIDYDNGCLGRLKPRKQIIEIEELSNSDQKNETLMHEIIEEINTQLSLKLEHDNINRLGMMLYMVLKDNDMVNWYFKDEPDDK